MKGLDDERGVPRYYVFEVVVFGLAPGPLLWGRVAAAAMRLAPSSMWFVDDPLILAAGSPKRERTWTFMKYCVLCG